MSMTQASSDYFKQNASQWDALRTGYFPEEVRKAAIARAYLRPEMSVVDVGGGTGFLSAGLAPLVRQVHLVDGSPEMLDTARRNLSAFTNVTYYHADGLSIPLEDASQDAVFANMYLHHAPDPLAAIREMARVLRPGGRLVITDLDTHTRAWMKDEMADVWLGFEREQVLGWLREAGLVNRLMECTGDSCCAKSQQIAGEDAAISVFVAIGTQAVPGTLNSVREHYALAATGQDSCCSPAPASAVQGLTIDTACCGGDGCGCGSNASLAPVDAAVPDYVYAPDDVAGLPEEAAGFSLGCGNPIALAGLRAGETVVDIGSGGGLDALLAAQRVGTTGRVIGVDMTPEMLERARRAAKGYPWVEFRRGQAEALPVDDASADVVMSNCVINLAADKGQVFSEAYRVLREGGRLEVSDVVTGGGLPAEAHTDPESWAACVSGALPEGEYLALARQAGFTDVTVRRRTASGSLGGVPLYSVIVEGRKDSQAAGSCSCA